MVVNPGSDFFSGPAQFFKLLDMQLDGTCKRGLCAVGQSKLLRCFPDDGGQGWIVHMADLREKVVFDLVIQTTAVPSEKL